MRALASSTLTSRGRLTLPKAVRRALGVKAGDSLAWELDDQGRLTVKAGRPHTLADTRAAVAAAGPAKKPASPPTVADMKAGIAAAIRRKHAGG
jgi:AbrB family looped-hinge helix DNA binding protein